MDEAVLEAETVDEGLERRARRAHRRRHIDLAGAAAVEIIGRGDAREHLAGRMIDGEDRNRDVGTQRAGALARQLLQVPLQRRFYGEAVEAALWRGRDHGIGRMRRQHRHRLAPIRHRLLFGTRDLVRRHDARQGDAVEHAVAGVARRVDRAIRPALLRRLRQGDQHGRLAQRQAARLLAEISERSRAHAFEVAAIGREAEIERQDFVLGERALDLDRAHHLSQLGSQGAFHAWLKKPGHLHGDGRCAGDDAAVDHQLRERAAERERVDAAMRLEALVLVGEQQRQKTRIDVLARGRQTPAALRRGVGPQQLAVAIDHEGGECEPLPDRHRAERGDPACAGGQNHDGCRQRRDEAPAQPAPLTR